MGFLSWLCGTGLSVIQKIYEIITQRNNAAVSGEEAKAKKRSSLSWLSDRHKMLWIEMEQRPELSRILETKVDLKAEPPTTAEKSFLNRVFIHFQEGWDFGKTEKIFPTQTMLADIRGFFSLPLPYTVWRTTKKSRDRKFVRIVERALKRNR